MRGRGRRRDMGVQPIESRRSALSSPNAATVVCFAMAAFLVCIALITAAKPKRSGAGAGLDDAVLMTVGDDERAGSWSAFFTRHPLPDDAIRDRIMAANGAAPGDVVCVPLDPAPDAATC